MPEELGGAFDERSAVTSVLMTEALAYGDMGLAVATLAPAAVSTAISLWGDAEQQATYLPEFTGESPPAAALALLEPTALFDPFELATKARREGDGFVIDGVKSLVPRAGDAELFVIGAELEGSGPALFIVESKADGVLFEAEPAMGIRAAGDRQLKLEARQGRLRRAARRGLRRGLRRVRAPRPPRLVRRRSWHRPGGARPPDPLRQGARRLR